MLRNREWLVFTLMQLLVLGLAAVGCLYAPQSALWFLLGSGGVLIGCNLIFTLWRYCRIRRLTQCLRRISTGNYSVDLTRFREGELSILEGELSRLVRMLGERDALLRRERNNLADALSDISHQLKTPLTSMGVLCDLLRRSDLPEEKRKQFTLTMAHQLSRMQWLLDTLLKLSRLDAGTIQFEQAPVNIPQLVQKALEGLRIPLELKGISLVLQGGELTFLGDMSWSAEALVNILKNCMEHTPSGGTITISWEENPLYLQLKIEDTGCGISREDLPHIFQRFYRGKNSSGDSVGIGLAMARSILVQQGGEITAASREGQGTVFQIRFYHQVV